MTNDNNETEQVDFVLHESFSPNFFRKYNIPFQTRQQSYGGFTAKVEISIKGKEEKITVPYKLSFRPGINQRQVDVTLAEDISTLLSRGGSRPRRPISNRRFGVELELTRPSHFSLKDVRDVLHQAGLDCEVYEHSQAKNVGAVKWKIVQDGSVQCRPGDRDCVRFELVSPVLAGGEGLQEIHTVLQALSTLQGIDVNKSAGALVQKVTRNVLKMLYLSTSDQDFTSTWRFPA